MHFNKNEGILHHSYHINVTTTYSRTFNLKLHANFEETRERIKNCRLPHLVVYTKVNLLELKRATHNTVPITGGNLI